MLARASARCERRHLDHVTLRRMDGERMAFRRQLRQGGDDVRRLGRAPDPVRLVDEMRRVCKPDGMYIVNHFRHATPGRRRLSST